MPDAALTLFATPSRRGPLLRWTVVGAVTLLLAAVPWLGDEVTLQFGISTLLFAVLAQGWNIIGGYTGYASFGNSVFYGLGTYGVAIAMAQLDLPFGVGILLGIVIAAVAAIALGLPILRLRGPYFAIASLGLSAAMSAVFSNFDFAGANIGLILPLVRADTLFYELSLALLAAVTLTIAWIARSRFGMGLIAIREDEDAAGVMGVNTTLYKILALTLSAVFTAAAGGIHAYWITFVDPGGAFDATLNVRMIIMAVFGGPGTVFGPVIGAFILSAVYEVLADSISTAAALIFGLVIIGAVVFMPKGLIDLGWGFRRTGWRYLLHNMQRSRL